MSIIDAKGILRELTVREAMRAMVIRMAYNASIEQATRSMIKYKVNAVLVTNEEETAIGVLSKTDLMSAYYAEIPLKTSVETIMTGPPLFCGPDESLDRALEMMRARGVHRLYVSGDMPGKAIGVLAYPDIVGILYRYCYRCEKNLIKRKSLQADDLQAWRLKVHEVMTNSIRAQDEHVQLFQVMEELSSYHLGATLITGKDSRALGLISKTDLIIAYRHGVSPAVQARTVMTSPVTTCSQDESLYKAIQTMILSDVKRLFIHKEDPVIIVGVLSLTDAARVRSGTCRACLATRIKVEDDAV